MSSVSLGLLLLQSVVIAVCMVAVVATRGGTSRQRQGLFLAGFALLVAFPLLPFLPKLFAVELGAALPAVPGVLREDVTWLFFLWLAGFAVSVLGWLRGIVGLRRVLARTRPLPASLAARCERHLHSPKVRLAISDAEFAPCVAGMWRPVLLLPGEAVHWNEAELCAVLHHEWSHLQRRDILVRVVADLACALHWFNPLIRLLRRRYLEEAEEACDGAALQTSGMLRGEYAATLLRFALRRMNQTRSGLVLSMADSENAGALERRVRSIMKGAERNSRRVWPALLLLVAALAVMGFGNAVDLRVGGDAPMGALEAEAQLRLMANPFPADR